MDYGVKAGRIQRPFDAGEASGDFLLAKVSDRTLTADTTKVATLPPGQTTPPPTVVTLAPVPPPAPKVDYDAPLVTGTRSLVRTPVQFGGGSTPGDQARGSPSRAGSQAPVPPNPHAFQNRVLTRS